MSRRRDITDAATAVFSDVGYAAATMRSLAKKLGIEAASIYSHVASKEELLKEICFGVADDFFAALHAADAAALIAPSAAPSTPEDRLRRAVKAHLSVLSDNSRAAQVFLHEWRHLSEPTLGDYRKLRRDYENHFTNLLTEGMELGHFNHTAPRPLALCLLGALNSTVAWYKPTGPVSPDQLADQLSGLFLNGLLVCDNHGHIRQNGVAIPQPVLFG